MATRGSFKQFYLGGTEDLDAWRARFVATLDPTEYLGALELVGSWDAWKRFKRDWPAFERDYLPSWLEEMEVALRSQAIRRVVSNATQDKQDSVSSAKWLAEGRWKEKSVGRPSKDEVIRQAKIAAGINAEVDDEIARVKLVS